jgi:3-methylfumaryl-CoA hydratase
MGSVLAESLKGWQPGTAELKRRADPWSAVAFAGLTGVPLPALEPGDALPPLWHWFTLTDHSAQSALGPDGHPADGPFLPPIPGRRRMFAGGRLTMDAPITVGADLSSRSSVASVTVKEGRSGELVFVTVRHELAVDGAAVGVEEQDIVYRSESGATAQRATPRPETGLPSAAGEWRLELATGPALLFRFSALTYNAHRIHYDRPYATQVEGYPDLVVHGPLLALLALELPRAHAPRRPVKSFEYRLARPAFAPARIVAAGRPDGTTVEVDVGASGGGSSLTGRIVLGVDR